jgi:DNA repair exonuclease SbcCD ATPase subunit
MLTQRVELIKQHTAEIQSTNNKLIDDKNERIQKAKDEIEKSEGDIAQLRCNIAEFTKLISDDEKQKKLFTELSHIKYKLETKIANIAKGIDFFEDNENCPTCSQEINQEFKCDIIIKKKLSMDEASDALVKVDQKLEKVTARLKDISKTQTEIGTHRSTIYITENNIKSKNQYIEELTNEIQLVETHNKKIDKSEIINLNEQLSDISMKYNKMVERKNLLDMAGILLKDSGIKAKIIKQYIPIINKFINKYLSMLDFFVNFTIDERFDEHILSRYRDEFTYGSFSEGEKFRINVAILFTWRAIAKLRNSINTNILFLDEILDSALDLSGTDDFLKILNQTDVDNIFILSPKSDQMFDKFENIIRFQKHRNFSRIVSI